MTEQDLIGLAVGIFLAVLVGGLGFFVLFLPQIDRWVEKMRKRRVKPT